MTEQQEGRLRALCFSYGVEFNAEHYTPQFDLPSGWVAGWVGGEPGTLYVGVDPEGLCVIVIDFPTVLDAYLTCALWSSINYDEHGEFLDADYDTDDFTDKARAAAVKDLADFLLANYADFEGMDDGQIGHDFWLTRNHHGAGFWDRGLGERGDRLTKAAQAYGGVDLYVNADGKIGGD